VPLLVKGRPVARELGRLFVAQKVSVAISIIPQPLTWFAAEQIAGFGLSRQRDDVPVLAAALHFRDDAAGKVVLVPAGLDQDHPEESRAAALTVSCATGH
jgi:hypothetical protein